jgi:hypothetical protein
MPADFRAPRRFQKTPCLATRRRWGNLYRTESSLDIQSEIAAVFNLGFMAAAITSSSKDVAEKTELGCVLPGAILAMQKVRPPVLVSRPQCQNPDARPGRRRGLGGARRSPSDPARSFCQQTGPMSRVNAHPNQAKPSAFRVRFGASTSLPGGLRSVLGCRRTLGTPVVMQQQQQQPRPPTT